MTTRKNEQPREESQDVLDTVDNPSLEDTASFGETAKIPWHLLPEEEKKRRYKEMKGQTEQKEIVTQKNQEKQEISNERKNLALEFLDDYKDSNKNRSGLSEIRKKKLDEVLKSLDAPEGIEQAEKIIGTIIKERAEYLEQWTTLKWSEADKRIMGYISEITPDFTDKEKVETFLGDSRLPVFEKYLNIAEQRIEKTKKIKIVDLKKQFEEIKGSQETSKKPEEEVLQPKEIPEEKNDIEKKEEPSPKLEEESSQEKVIKSLFSEREVAISALSKASTEEEKQKLLKEKKIYSDQIIEKSSELPEFKNVKSEIEDEKEKQWLIGLATSGYKNAEGYKDWHKNIYFDDVIKNSNLTEQQKNKIFEEKGIVNGNWFDPVKLNKEQVAVAIEMGLDVNKIKHSHWWNPFSEKIRTGRRVFKNMEEFNDYLNDYKSKKIDQKIQKRVDERKQEIIEKNSDPIIDNKINKINKFLSHSKVELPKDLSVEEKLNLLSSLRNKWNKIKEINNAVKNEKDIKKEDGKIINTSNIKGQFEVYDIKSKFSEEIIKIAEKLTGKNLKKEAAEKTGYAFDKNFGKQKEYQHWLTSEVEKIFEDTKTDIENKTGKKIKVKSLSLEELLQKGLLKREKVEKIKKSKIPEVKEVPKINTGAELKPLKRLVDKENNIEDKIKEDKKEKKEKTKSEIMEELTEEESKDLDKIRKRANEIAKGKTPEQIDEIRWQMASDRDRYIKNIPAQRKIKKVTDIWDIPRVLETESLLDSDLKPFTAERFNKWLEETRSLYEEMIVKGLKKEEILDNLNFLHFTSAGGLREKVFTLLGDEIEKELTFKNK